MAIEGIRSAVGAAAAGTSQSMVKPVTGSETKEVEVQSSQQATASADAAVISKANQQNAGSGTSEEGKEKEQEKQLSDKTIKQRISDINRKLNNNTIAEFGYHDETNRVTIKIVDKDTKETIKEIPPEKTLDLIAKAWELAGILIDEKR